jgi:hypothetical protein
MGWRVWAAPPSFTSARALTTTTNGGANPTKVDGIPNPTKVDSRSRSKRWLRIFEQGGKWNRGLTAGMFCLRIRSDHEETSAPEPHAGLQGESGLGCLEERSNDGAVG